jgi:hypothetical protein
LVEHAEWRSPTTTKPEPKWNAESSFFRMGEGLGGTTGVRPRR